MATVNLGAIKFNWKGAYNNSTAYVVDDVVSSGGSSYICILASQGNAVSNGTYWNLMAEAGTDGTNVATTLTTQGDILYRDGSGLQRLAKGTAGQVLQINTGATAPEWVTAGGGIVSSGTFANGRNFGTYSFDNQTNSSSTSYVDMNGSEWNVGAGALTANKTCMIQYSVISYLDDWTHSTLALQVSTNDGGAYDYVGGNSEDVHDEWHELASGTNATGRRTGFHIISFTSGQTPRFRMKCKIYSGSNGLKINYDAGNNGTVKSYYQAWWV